VVTIEKFTIRLINVRILKYERRKIILISFYREHENKFVDWIKIAKIIFNVVFLQNHNSNKKFKESRHFSYLNLADEILYLYCHKLSTLFAFDGEDYSPIIVVFGWGRLRPSISI
jgi:hypothetical protein